MNLAFKDGTHGGFVDSEIVRIAGGPFCHVELWMSGPREAAVCFSSRQPDGTGYAVVDLSAPLYTCIEFPATQAQMDFTRGFAAGTGHKRYNMAGIIGFLGPLKTTDNYDLFCSEWCCSWAQQAMGMFPNAIPSRTAPTPLALLCGWTPPK
jgi:hypothetical protein